MSLEMKTQRNLWDLLIPVFHQQFLYGSGSWDTAGPVEALITALSAR